MSDWNQLETQLRSWKPRRPSAELKGSIFATTGLIQPAVPVRPINVSTWRWLAPAAACCLTLFTLFGGNNSRLNHPRANDDHTIFAVAMGSLTASNYGSTLPTKWFGLSAADENLEWNVWSKTSFDWTKEGQFLSTNRSLRSAQTNYLMQ